MTDPAAPEQPTFPIPKDWKFDPVMAMKALNGRGHGGFLGIQYHAHGSDWIEIALPWREDLVGVPEIGVLASGPLISLLDNATSLAVWTRRNQFAPQATLDLRVDYVRAATPGKTVIGRGECYQIKKSIAFVRGIAFEDDPADPIAHAAGIFMLVGL